MTCFSRWQCWVESTSSTLRVIACESVNVGAIANIIILVFRQLPQIIIAAIRFLSFLLFCSVCVCKYNLSYYINGNFSLQRLLGVRDHQVEISNLLDSSSSLTNALLCNFLFACSRAGKFKHLIYCAPIKCLIAVQLWVRGLWVRDSSAPLIMYPLW
jgi:hypothetical protein